MVLPNQSIPWAVGLLAAVIIAALLAMPGTRSERAAAQLERLHDFSESRYRQQWPFRTKQVRLRCTEFGNFTFTELPFGDSYYMYSQMGAGNTGPLRPYAEALTGKGNPNFFVQLAKERCAESPLEF